MRVTSMWAIGFVAMVAATGMVNASSSVAAESSVDRHGVGGAIYTSSQPMPDGANVCVKAEEPQRVEVIERIGHGGSTYQSKATQAGDCQREQKRVDVVQRVGQGGSIYSSSHTMNN